MSMIGMFIRINQDELSKYIEDSSLLEKRIDDSWERPDPNFLDIDKAWDAISYLITGFPLQAIERAKEPLRWAIFGALVLDENQDLGYGPANYLSASQVKEVSIALSEIEAKALSVNFDATKMNELEIYPGSWTSAVEDFDYLSTHFNLLKEFYNMASTHHQAVITYIS